MLLYIKGHVNNAGVARIRAVVITLLVLNALFFFIFFSECQKQLFGSPCFVSGIVCNVRILRGGGKFLGHQLPEMAERKLNAAPVFFSFFFAASIITVTAIITVKNFLRKSPDWLNTPPGDSLGQIFPKNSFLQLLLCAVV